MRNQLVIGNWKMNGTLAENLGLLHQIRAGFAASDASLAVCVPFPYLAQAKSVLAGSSIKWGAQNVSSFSMGAYTGEVSAAMLSDFACSYVLVGHSERRCLFGESNVLVAEKAEIALAQGLTPVVCVGESLAERQRGQTLAVVCAQLKAVIDHCGIAAVARMVLAYEPVWAIGTGLTATPEQAQEVHAALRACIADFDVEVANRVSILYGGSVRAGNAAELFGQKDIDGGLIGGASLNAMDFLAIAKAV